MAVGAPNRVSSGQAQSSSPIPVAKRFADGCRTTAVRFGIVLAPDDLAGRRAADAIAQDIGRQISCPAIVVSRRTQPELLAALALHQVDFAQVDPATLVVGGRVVALTILGAYSAAADTAARTAAPPRLWAREDGPVRGLADARGRRLVLGPELTVGGDIAPRSALLAAGVPVAVDPSAGTRTSAAPTTRSVDDAAALRAVRNGDAALALTRGSVGAAPTRGLRAVWTGERPLADVLVIRPGVDNAVRRLLMSAVRDVPGALWAPLAARQGIRTPTPLLPVPPDLYDPVAVQIDGLTSAGLVP